MFNFIRIKKEGACCIEFDASKIQIFEICCDVDNCYYLMGYTSNNMYEITSGTFDECHYLLNQLHAVLNINIIDIR